MGKPPSEDDTSYLAIAEGRGLSVSPGAGGRAEGSAILRMGVR